MNHIKNTLLICLALMLTPSAWADSFRYLPQAASIKHMTTWVVPGKYDCFGNQTITVTIRKDHPGYVDLIYKGHTYHMLPVHSNTGALRLESKAGGVFWLQLSAKSMLFSNKGSRLADDCHNRATPVNASVNVPPAGDSLQIQVPDLPIAPPPPPPTAAEQKAITD